MTQNTRAASCIPLRMAGMAGGMAEILWVTAYCIANSMNCAVVARQVTASVWPAAAEWAFAPALGIFIHFDVKRNAGINAARTFG